MTITPTLQRKIDLLRKLAAEDKPPQSRERMIHAECCKAFRAAMPSHQATFRRESAGSTGTHRSVLSDLPAT